MVGNPKQPFATIFTFDIIIHRYRRGLWLPMVGGFCLPKKEV